MKLHASLTYPAPLIQVHEMLCNPDYRAVRARGHDVSTAVSTDAESVKLTSEVPIPSSVRQGPGGRILGAAKSITLIEVVDTVVDGSFRYRITLRPGSLPIQGHAEITVSEDGSQSIATLSGDIHITVPLFGAMVEKSLLSRLPALCASEEDAAAQYLRR